MRLVYIILAHQLPDLLIRLVRRLQTPHATFFIHVDKKSSTHIFEQVRTGLQDVPSVHFLQRYTCYWGGFGHVQATLEGIRELMTRKLPFDYAILLTGQDYPLQTNKKIESFLSRNAGMSFLSYVPLPSQSWPVMDRIECWHYHLWGRHIRFPMNARGGRFLRMKKLVNVLLPAKRKFLPGLRPYAGYSYWCLSRAAIEYIFAYIDRHPDFVRFFRSTCIADEVFFQTLLLNSSPLETIIDDSVRYMDWPKDNKGHPAILTNKDFNVLRSSGKLFARKFDTSVDDDILDMIDKHLLQESSE